MNTKMFWNVIESIKANSSFCSDKDYLAFITELVNKLADMEIPEIIKWQHIFTEYLNPYFPPNILTYR